MPFRDRIEAGRRLAAALTSYRDGPAVVVVALPRGGVAVGAEVARSLRLPLDIVVTRKIASPEDPEYAVGALTEEGTVVWGPDGEPKAAWVPKIVAAERAEAERRLRTYRRGLPTRDFAGKTLLVVDDGVATGLTMEAALRALRTMRPTRLVLAVPHGARDSLERLRPLADEVVALETPEWYGSVGSLYGSFPQVSDDEVVALLKELS